MDRPESCRTWAQRRRCLRCCCSLLPYRSYCRCCRRSCRRCCRRCCHRSCRRSCRRCCHRCCCRSCCRCCYPSCCRCYCRCCCRCWCCSRYCCRSWCCYRCCYRSWCCCRCCFRSCCRNRAPRVRAALGAAVRVAAAAAAAAARPHGHRAQRDHHRRHPLESSIRFSCRLAPWPPVELAGIGAPSRSRPIGGSSTPTNRPESPLDSCTHSDVDSLNDPTSRTCPYPQHQHTGAPLLQMEKAHRASVGAIDEDVLAALGRVLGEGRAGVAGRLLVNRRLAIVKDRSASRCRIGASPD